MLREFRLLTLREQIMNTKSLWMPLSLVCLAALVAACQPVQPQAAAGQPPASQTGQHTTVKPADPVEVQIQNAMSAAPLVVAQDATILGYTTEEGNETVVLREGNNGWTCYTDWPVSPGNDPACYDAVFSAWNDAYFAGSEPAITAPGIGYMLAGGSDPSNTDPMALEPAAGEEWVTTPPHIMVVMPGDLDPSVFTTDPHSGEPYIMWEGTPYEHLMVPVVPAVATSNGPLTATASAEEQIQNMRSAATAVIVDNATLMGYPGEEGGDMVVLQEGTNGWTCYPDRLVSPGDDPSCNDATMEEGFANGTTRDVSQPGLSYMLAGGSDESNVDPTASGPPEGEDWITTPPHVMMMVSGGFRSGQLHHRPHVRLSVHHVRRHGLRAPDGSGGRHGRYCTGHTNAAAGRQGGRDGSSQGSGPAGTEPPALWCLLQCQSGVCGRLHDRSTWRLHCRMLDTGSAAIRHWLWHGDRH